MTLDMFKYPNSAGYYEVDTSIDAANAIEASGRATSIREQIKRYFNVALYATADEVAFVLGEDILAVRPRITELVKQGFLKDSGKRRPNRSGKMARVLEVV